MGIRSIYLRDEIDTAIDRLAAREGRSRSNMIAVLLRRGLVADGHPDPMAPPSNRQDQRRAS